MTCTLYFDYSSYVLVTYRFYGGSFHIFNLIYAFIHLYCLMYDDSINVSPYTHYLQFGVMGWLTYQ